MTTKEDAFNTIADYNRVMRSLRFGVNNLINELLEINNRQHVEFEDDEIILYLDGHTYTVAEVLDVDKIIADNEWGVDTEIDIEDLCVDDLLAIAQKMTQTIFKTEKS